MEGDGGRCGGIEQCDETFAVLLTYSLCFCGIFKPFQILKMIFSAFSHCQSYERAKICCRMSSAGGSLFLCNFYSYKLYRTSGGPFPLHRGAGAKYSRSSRCLLSSSVYRGFCITWSATYFNGKYVMLLPPGQCMAGCKYHRGSS